MKIALHGAFVDTPTALKTASIDETFARYEMHSYIHTLKGKDADRKVLRTNKYIILKPNNLPLNFVKGKTDAYGTHPHHRRADNSFAIPTAASRNYVIPKSI